MQTNTPPLQVAAEDVVWDMTTDILVVGFGGAGACAAIEAAEQGASVLAVDRFDGGGATSASGGVYYGGGTRFQHEAGFEDTPEEMYRYLDVELANIVSEKTLRKFCDESAANLDWLIGQGLEYSGKFSPEKTSYPGKNIFLYYSGNEYNPRFAAIAKPAPRGHRVVGSGLTGRIFYAKLHAAAEKLGVKLLTDSPVTRLVIDAEGAVIGAEVQQISAVPSALAKHRKIYRRAKRLVGLINSAKAEAILGAVAEVESEVKARLLIRARKGVILSTGGFIFNREMVREHSPAHIDAQPLGTPGCDGSGIALGLSAGGVTRRMESVMASRTIAPPTAFVEGLIVDAEGKRITAEDEYACTLGRRIVDSPGSVAWLILDKALYRKAFFDSLPGKGRLLVIHCLPAMASIFFGSRKARTPEELAKKCKMPVDAFRSALTDYNRIGHGEIDDPFGKKKEYRHALDEGPFYAIDISVRSKTAPLTTLTLGGLDVDEESGMAKRADGTLIHGLYAAGRTAFGIASNYYLSGLSVADLVFSGRRAGHHAAKRNSSANA